MKSAQQSTMRCDKARFSLTTREINNAEYYYHYHRNIDLFLIYFGFNALICEIENVNAFKIFPFGSIKYI